MDPGFWYSWWMRTGFTIKETLVCAAVFAVLLALIVVVLGRFRSEARRQVDAEQLRDIDRGLVLSGQCGPDSYLLPSMVDRGDTTMPDDGVVAKDLPGSIMSLLIYNGFFSPAMCVSPLETNPRVQVVAKYSYDNPTAAVTPAQALWDPSFRSAPDNGGAGGPGNLSYAIMPPCGARRAHFTNDFQANEAVLSNRGPAYVARGSGAGLSWQLAPSKPAGSTSETPVGVGSLALGVHGTARAWRGLVVYNDNHIALERDCCPGTTPFTFSGLPSGSRSQLDNLFVNEDDTTRAAASETLEDAAGKNTNNFLRLWTAGKQRVHDEAWWQAKKRGESMGLNSGCLDAITPWYD